MCMCLCVCVCVRACVRECACHLCDNMTHSMIHPQHPSPLPGCLLPPAPPLPRSSPPLRASGRRPLLPLPGGGGGVQRRQGGRWGALWRRGGAPRTGGRQLSQHGAAQHRPHGARGGHGREGGEGGEREREGEAGRGRGVGNGVAGWRRMGETTGRQRICLGGVQQEVPFARWMALWCGPCKGAVCRHVSASQSVGRSLGWLVGWLVS